MNTPCRDVLVCSKSHQFGEALLFHLEAKAPLKFMQCSRDNAMHSQPNCYLAKNICGYHNLCQTWRTLSDALPEKNQRSPSDATSRRICATIQALSWKLRVEGSPARLLLWFGLLAGACFRRQSCERQWAGCCGGKVHEERVT